jgi:tetratricopeptide (TPR) repeat protein
MDLLNFDQASLYFEEPVSEEVGRLIADAGTACADGSPEPLLHKAYFLAPESLLVLVAVYRYYFYQHRLEEALLVGERALRIVGRRLGLPDEWSRLNPALLGQAVMRSMGLLRFYLHVLKATGYVYLRLGRIEQGRAQIEKLIELDSHDRFGGKALLSVIVEAVAARLEEAA